MLERVFSGQIFARLVNTALALDPAAEEKLTALNGRRISITLEWREQPWILAVEEGKIILPDDHQSPCDVRLSGNLEGLLQLFKSTTQHHEKPRGKLYIEGDLYAAQQFQRVMGELKPDFESILKRRFGEKLGARLATEARRLQENGEVVKNAIYERLEDFFSEQAATRSENQAFAARVQRLTTRLQAVEKMLASMERR